MLTDNDLKFIYKGIPGVPIAFIIEEDNLYDLAVSREHSKLFFEYDEVIDISDQYPDHDGIVIRFLKNNEILEELKTTEYFGSILLSNPLIVNYMCHPYGHYAESLYSKFINYEFVLINRPDVTENSPKFRNEQYTPLDPSIKCTKIGNECRCGWTI